MAKQSSVNLDITNNADGFSIAGGSTSRTLGVSGADITLVGSGTATLTFPTTSTTIAGLGITQEFTALQSFSAGISAANINSTTSKITSSNVNATRYLAFVGGTGNTGIFIDDVTTPLTYNPLGGNIGAKKVTLTTSSNVLTLDSTSPNVTLTDGSNVAIFGLDSFAANYTSGRFVLSNDGDGLDINALNGITLDPGSGVVEIASAVVSDDGYRITSNAIKALTGTTYTLLVGDGGKIITSSNAATQIFTIPTGLPIGFNCSVIQLGTGPVGFVGASGVTLNTYAGKTMMAGQYAAVSIIEYATNLVNIAGGLTT